MFSFVLFNTVCFLW